MRFSWGWGTTRFVVLIGTVAIKVNRPRPIWVLRRLIQYWVTGVACSRLLAYAEDPLESGFTGIFLPASTPTGASTVSGRKLHGVSSFRPFGRSAG